MVDVLLIIACLFFVAAVGAAIEYYRNLMRIRREYEKAKEMFNDVLLSFSRELKRVADGVQTLYYKVEGSSSKSTEAARKVEELEGQLKRLEVKTKEALEVKEEVELKFKDVEKQMRDIQGSQKEIMSKISLLEEKIQKMPASPEARVEAVIPIKREKALARLTETELTVLEMLVAEGSKTAPEIKKRIGLSREHTARLMKKLYEEGYLERDSSKIPFKYSIKKEMARILKKTETETV